MPVKIDIDMSGLEDLQRKLENIRKNQLPFAMSKAINNTAYYAHKDAVNEMKHVFDRPTPFVLKGLKYKKSDKENLTAIVGYRVDAPFVKNDGRAMIRPHVEGGKRGSKRVEKLLRSRGIIDADEYVTPSRFAKLNAYGNVTQGWMNKMLSDLGAQFDSKQNTAAGKKARFFVGTFGKKQQKMIVQRVNKTRIIPFLIIIKEPKYKKRFDLHGVVGHSVKKNFKKEFRKAFADAMRTAWR